MNDDSFYGLPPAWRDAWGWHGPLPGEDGRDYRDRLEEERNITDRATEYARDSAKWREEEQHGKRG